MKIHEYQAKEILRRYGVATPRGKVIEDPGEARAICEEMGGKCVVKAQIHAGGRGKGGGVKVAKSPAEATEYAGKILGMQLVTHQTGPEGQKVRKVLIEEAADIAQEFYVAVTLDRQSGGRSSSRRASAAWTSKRSRAKNPRGDPPRRGRSAARSDSVPGAPRRARAGAQGRCRGAGREARQRRWSPPTSTPTLRSPK